MKKFNILLFVLWLIVGLAVMISGNVTVFNYGLVWACFMLELFSQMIPRD